MSFLRPATPGFLITFAATILLLIVTLSVPLLKSVYYLKASVVVDNGVANLTLGTLGYCLQYGSTSICSNASVGYSFDINQQIAKGLPLQIPMTTVKWLTGALVLNIVALISSAIATLLGSLAHVREMSMSRRTTLVSGFSSTIAFLALAFNIGFTLFARNRVKAIPGGSASIGSALWLSLAAWLLLSIGTCFFTIGRRCIQGKRQKGPNDFNGSEEWTNNPPTGFTGFKTRRTTPPETGLPLFPEMPKAPQRVEEEGEPQVAFVNGDVVVTQAPSRSPSSPHLSNAPGQVSGHTQGGTSYYSVASQPLSPHSPGPSEARNFAGAAESPEAHPLLPYPHNPNTLNPSLPYFIVPQSPARSPSYASPPPPENFGHQTSYPPYPSTQFPFPPTQDYHNSSPYNNAQPSQPSFNYRPSSHPTPPPDNSLPLSSNHALAASGYVPSHMLNPPSGAPPDYDMTSATYPQQRLPSYNY